VAALIVAIIGTVLLITYVNGAESRAYAETETREVYVVKDSIAAGTAAGAVAKSVEKKALPAASLADSAVTDLGSIQGKVAAVALEPGEVLLESRFASANELRGPNRFAVPEGMQELTLKLPIERVVGGTLSAGDTVGVFLSFPKDEGAPAQTQLTYHKVLVTGVQMTSGAVAQNNATAAPTAPASGTARSSSTANGEYLVTLARPTADAERIVFATEFGTLYLSKEPGSANENNAGTVDRTKVLR
jgi:pilus assembly protein CpaB